MDVSNVTNDDGIQCAQLLNLLKAGRWDLSSKDAEALVSSKRWLAAVAGQMAEKLKAPAAPAPEAQTMRVKAMGPLSAKQQKSRTRKK